VPAEIVKLVNDEPNSVVPSALDIETFPATWLSKKPLFVLTSPPHPIIPLKIVSGLMVNDMSTAVPPVTVTPESM
jgi:hypothetical protein